MFDSNLRYLPPGLSILIYVDSISKDSKLYKAGARKKQKLEAAVPHDKGDPDVESENIIRVRINNEWHETNDAVDYSIERLEYAGLMPEAPEYFTKQNHPMKGSL